MDKVIEMMIVDFDTKFESKQQIGSVMAGKTFLTNVNLILNDNITNQRKLDDITFEKILLDQNMDRRVLNRTLVEVMNHCEKTLFTVLDMLQSDELDPAEYTIDCRYNWNKLMGTDQDVYLSQYGVLNTLLRLTEPK